MNCELKFLEKTIDFTRGIIYPHYVIGKRFYISYEREDHEMVFPALICKNVRPGEKPFRLTWFKICGGESWQGKNGREISEIYLKPAGHIDFKTTNLELIRCKLEKTFNSNTIGFPPTDFKVKINLTIGRE